MIAFIGDKRAVHGVEPICKVLPIAPATYHTHEAQRRDPLRLSARACWDLAVRVEVPRVAMSLIVSTPKFAPIPTRWPEQK
jgi:putative transposase